MKPNANSNQYFNECSDLINLMKAKVSGKQMLECVCDFALKMHFIKSTPMCENAINNNTRKREKTTRANISKVIHRIV